MISLCCACRAHGSTGSFRRHPSPRTCDQLHQPKASIPTSRNRQMLQAALLEGFSLPQNLPSASICPPLPLSPPPQIQTGGGRNQNRGSSCRRVSKRRFLKKFVQNLKKRVWWISTRRSRWRSCEARPMPSGSARFSSGPFRNVHFPALSHVSLSPARENNFSKILDVDE